MNSQEAEDIVRKHLAELGVENPEQVEIYPRRLFKLAKQPVYAHSAEEAAEFYAQGYSPLPLTGIATSADVVKAKVVDLERQIEAALDSLGTDDRQRVVREIYGDGDPAEQAAPIAAEVVAAPASVVPAALAQPAKKKAGRPKQKKV
jgi:hypothetical protein